MDNGNNGSRIEMAKDIGRLEMQVKNLTEAVRSQTDAINRLQEYLIERDKSGGCKNLLNLKSEYEGHIKYHNKSEHKWGFWTLMKRKPLVAILIGILVSSFLVSIGYSGVEIINGILKKILMGQ